LSLAPEYILEGKWTTMVDESTLNLNGNSTRHHSNTLHCRLHAVPPLNNVFCHFFRSSTTV
jgi:hypothetical protein